MRLFSARLAPLLLAPLLPLAGAENSVPAPPGPVISPEEPAPSTGNSLLSALRRSLSANPDMDMTVITEMTDAGRKLPAVSPEHPVYYQAEPSGDREMGAIVAHEQTMLPEEVEPLLTRGLAVNGYHPAQTPEHPPSLLVYYLWGTHNAIDPDIAEIAPNQLVRNVLDRALLVGGKKFSDDVAEVIRDTQIWKLAGSVGPAPVYYFKMKHPNNERLLVQTMDDVYYVVASAFDYQSVAKGKPILLWRTRMTVSSVGVWMKKAVPGVVASAGKYFGREMTEPLIFNQSATPEGKVKIGIPTVVDPLPAPPDPRQK